MKVDYSFCESLKVKGKVETVLSRGRDRDRKTASTLVKPTTRNFSKAELV